MNIRNKFQKIGIFTQITLLTIISVVTISTISTVFLLKHFSSSIKAKDCFLVEEAAEKIYNFARDKYNNIYNQQNFLHTFRIAYTISATRQNPSLLYQAENLSQITDYLTTLIYSDNTICDVILFTSSGQAFARSSGSGRTISLSYDFNGLPYIQDFSHSSHTITVAYDDSPGYLSLSADSQSAAAISFITKIYDTTMPTKSIITGYLIVNFSLNSFHEIIDEIDIITNGSYYIINEQDQIIYSNDPGLLNTSFSELSFTKSNILFDKTLGNSAGIRIMGALSDDSLWKNTYLLIFKMLLVTMTGILCMVLIITLLHKHYAKKFHELATAMLDISTGNFTIRLPVKNHDEIGYLSHAFNTMCETLDVYIQKTYLAENKRRSAELYALQAQINPHFLANTIESIRMYALENNNYEIAEMLKKFGDLFRCMIQFDSDIIDIKDEMKYITSYLDLQEFRFQDRLSVNIRCPADIYSFGIPRFTLQPVIENSLSYGSRGSQPLALNIVLSAEEGILKILISDNGPGIPADKLEQLNSHIQGNAVFDEFGVALRNIHSRITLLFGAQYGLSISNNVHRGITVTITFPAKEKKELLTYVQTAYRR